MKLLLTAALAALTLISSAPGAGDEPAAAARPTTVADLAWLSGTWVTAQEGVYLEETWSTPEADSLVGMFRWVQGGTTGMYELMSIEQEDAGPVFRLRHFNRGLSPWESEAGGIESFALVSSEGTTAVFEDPASEDVRRVTYARDGEVLAITLDRVEGEPMAFSFKRRSAR